MFKKQSNKYNWSYSLVNIVLLNGLFFSSMTAAQTTSIDLSQPAGVDLYLDTTVNGNAVGLVHLGYAQGKLYDDAMALHQLGFHLPKKHSRRFI